MPLQAGGGLRGLPHADAAGLPADHAALPDPLDQDLGEDRAVSAARLPGGRVNDRRWLAAGAAGLFAALSVLAALPGCRSPAGETPGAGVGSGVGTPAETG